MLKPGGRIGSYVIEQELGRGGMGVVFRARDERLERDVAIKALPEDLRNDPDRLERFRREARTVAQLSHPHIAQIHHLLEQDGQTYLVLELVRGKSLAEVIEHRRLDLTTSLRLAAQIAGALEAAHAKGVIHRDLKPGNVMVAEDGTARVLDFGLAVMRSHASPWVGDETIGPGGSTGDKVVGTPGFMAPEQARGEAIDHRADLFSFGCLLYELLARRPAFEGRNHAARLTSTLTTEPDLRSLRAPPAVVGMLEACLAKSAHRRLASAAEARRILETALEPESTRAPEPAPATKRNPTNLRPPVDQFIGRADDLRELAELLEHTRLVTLTGAGGCGKTRLASELGQRIVEQFPGGVWMVELAPVSSPDLLVQTIAGVLNAKEQPLKDGIAARLSSPSPALLILDNCEHLLDEASDFVNWLMGAVAEARVVVTSREPLGIAGERVWRVRNLSLPPASAIRPPSASRAGLGSFGSGSGSRGSATPRSGSGTGSSSGSGSGLDMDVLLATEAVALFVDRARQVQPGFELTPHNAPAVVSICSRLDGIPLAIELAAARVKVLPPEQLEEKLGDRFRLLRAGRGRTERHQTLRAAMDWSYRLLHEDERRCLRTLSVFFGGCTLEAATYVTAGPEGDEFETLDLLTNLVDKSLLIAEDRDGVARYRLLESVRVFALEELAASPEEAEAAQRRHLEFFHDLARRHGERPVASAADYERLEQDHENLLQAIRYASGDRQHTLVALEMCYLLRRYWTVRAGIAALRAASELAYGAPGAEAFPEQFGHVCWMLGISFGYAGRSQEAERLLEQSLQIGREHQLPVVELMAITQMGVLATRQNDLDRGALLLTEALAISRRLQDPAREAQTIYHLGALAMHRDDFTGARDQFLKAAAAFERIGDARSAWGRVGAAVVAHRAGDEGAALRLLREALLEMSARGNTIGVGNLMHACAEFAEAWGEPGPCPRWIGFSDVDGTRDGVIRSRKEQERHDQLVERLKAALGPDAYEQGYRQGQMLSLEEAAGEADAWLANRVAGRGGR